MDLFICHAGSDWLIILESSVARRICLRPFGSASCNGLCRQVRMPSIVNWHQNTLNHHRPACECEYTHQRQQQQDEPHLLPAVSGRDLTATATPPHGQINQQACRNNCWAAWLIHGRWCLGCSWAVEGCAKGYHTGTWDINLLRTHGLTLTQSWLHACVHVPEPFRSSPIGNGLSSHPGCKLRSSVSQAQMGPPRFQSRQSKIRLPSTYPDPINGV